jgi:hypothetical protein
MGAYGYLTAHRTQIVDTVSDILDGPAGNEPQGPETTS